MEALIRKASVLLEALPYIRTFHGEIFVVKYGGHAMVKPELQDSFAQDMVLLKYVGIHPVVVHGGGPQIDHMLQTLGVQSTRIEGLRVTDDRTMDVVEMVLGGAVNQQIVSLICRHGGRAVGLTGRDDSFIRAKRLTHMTTESGNEVDPGRVGSVETIRPEVVHQLVHGGFVPVIAPVAVDEDGHSLNINADVIAGEIAKAVGARKLVLMTDTEGVKDASGTILRSLRAEQVATLQQQKVIRDGMIPKVRHALDAVQSGVRKAHIIDGRVEHAVLLEIFTTEGIGTEITS